ncbi:MAG: aminotransferase class III-fold pyridoxal phosphate-dependent enzyme [Dethiobacter sp.]|jgi:acetylornithine/succinyldiaminopimelate/putrescine aminotransferase/predicted amino acid dehydrogenase|nr:aminotransferase class III-fold pyridoxal phosphate-dependent enzyme [Dethiobacter sp.]
MHPYTQYVNPHLGNLLENIKLDKSFVRGDGCYLYDSAGNRYLDCIAAYGALPFGHNPPAIWDSVNSVQLSQEPGFVQPSALNAAGELAKRLIELAPQGLAYVTFTNSGTEAAEAAIKLCRSATGRRGILSTENSFHGKTLGALSATGNNYYQAPFGAPFAEFNYVPFGDLASLDAELKKNPELYAAFLVEPIQGEGGIVVPPKGYLAEAMKVCEQYGVLLVADEIQTGLGRTGTLFACEDEGIIPDVMLLAKALGGGLMPIGACLSRAEIYTRDFARKHSSTFAGGSLACRVGLKSLEILCDEKQPLLDDINARGHVLKSGLLSLQEKYPHIVKAIRGRGLMLGIEFGIDGDTFPGSLLGIMAEQELLTPVISAYLLNKEKIRVAPTLNGNAVIRIEPPLTITEDQCREALAGIERMLAVLTQGNTAKLLSFMLGENEERQYTVFTPGLPNRIYPSGDDSEGRFAFLMHPLDLQSYHQFDDSLLSFNESELAELTGRWNDLIDPFVVAKTHITSSCGKKAYGEFIVVPRTTEELVEMPKKQALEELKAAVTLAKERGARIVGLGAYTSVVSMGGLYVKDEGVPVTTGNSYTVVAAIDAVNTALKRLDMSPSHATAAVIGATGAIGKGLSTLLSETVSSLILIGNPNHKESSINRLQGIAAEIYRYLASLLENNHQFTPGSIGSVLAESKELPPSTAPLSDFVEFVRGSSRKNRLISVSTSINEVLPRADVVVSATNTMGKIIHAGNLKHGAVVCDISRPANVSEDVERVRPDVLVLDGGVVEVPGLPSLGWNFGFEEGLAYACMAETMMLALDQHYTNFSLGSSGITLESILKTRELANKHGFRLASFRSFNHPLSEERWQAVLAARQQHRTMPGTASN